MTRRPSNVMLEIVPAGEARQGPSAPPSSPESPVLHAALISVFCSTPLSDKDSSYLLPLCHPGLSVGVRGHSLLCGHCDRTRTCKGASPRAMGEQQGSKTKSITSLDHLAPPTPGICISSRNHQQLLSWVQPKSGRHHRTQSSDLSS